MGLQIRRGTDAQRLTTLFAEGEPIYVVDTEKLYIGDGVTVGGIEVSGETNNDPTFNSITVTTTATVAELVFSGDGIPIISRDQLLGYTGSRGYTGSQGTTGFVGSKGDQGDLGYTGSAGTNGTNGFTGSQGFTGSAGIGFTGSKGDTGYTGSQGAAGQSSSLYRYNAKVSATSGDPGNTFLIWNTSTQRLATQINVSHMDGLSNDIDVFLELISTGDTIILQDRNDSDNYQTWTVSNTPTVIPNNYAQIPVTLVTSTGTGYSNFSGGHDLLFIIQSAGIQGPIGYTGSKGDIGFTGSAGISADQTLNTNSNVIFNSVVTQDVVSAGGYPVNANGLALINVGNTQSAAMVVSNYTPGLIPALQVRGWGQNRPGTVTSATNAGPIMIFESARGSTSTPFAPQSGDTLMSIQAGGYDGARWSSDTNLAPFSMVVLATETHIGNATTTTNAGSRVFFRSQPPGIRLDSTSRQVFFNQNWTAGSTSAPPLNNIVFGTAFNDTPTLIHSNNTSTFTGFGATNVNLVNTKNTIFGVPFEDTSPDNTTLTGTNYILFSSGRRSGASGRRNTVQSGDSLGNLYFYGQTANSATSVGSAGGTINFKTLENWSGSARGTQAIIQTVNSGTTDVTFRLVLDNRSHQYYSEKHQFYKPDGTQIAELNTSSITAYTHILPSADGVYDLGSSSKKWRSLYVTTSTIYIDNNAVSVSGGQLTINGNTQIGPIGYTGSQGNIGYTGSQGATGAQGPGITLSTASGTQSLTTSSGLLASITDNQGKLAYYNNTLNDWRYVSDNSDVFVTSYSIQYLVVAGGGASDQGGGGAGGYSTGTTSVTGGTSYTITVGAGGTAAAGGTANGGNGNNSSISSLSTSTGGGGGAWSTNTPGSGGSGGGAGQTGSGTYAGGTGTAGQGNNGGSNGGFNTPRYPGGGGGGAGAVGQNAQSGSQAGNGGIGKQWFDGNYYAGGGGGGNNTTGGTTTGGQGGGGAGGYGTNGGPPTAGTENTGGGGGGDGGTGYAGGSGVVIIRYSGSQVGSGGTVTSAGGYTYHTFTGSGTFTA